MTALRTALRSRWNRSYTLLLLWVGSGFVMGLYALAISIPPIGTPL